ncbi:hypothetical protein JTB14_036583 [Gonioctena quinquepunctata]|nr:hypothetical protein JTB14_036583 [Gonioctena quinquepunctata]
MPMTVHEILVHGADIVDHCILPVEASEAKNIEMKKVREGYTCEKSRYCKNYDVMRYMHVATDPYLTFLRNHGQKRKGVANEDVSSLLETQYDFIKEEK